MKCHKNTQSPIAAQKILLLCLPDTIKHEIIGDLEEEFNLQLVQFGHQRAKYYYWKQAIISIFQFIIIRANSSISSSNYKQKLSLVLGVTVFTISMLLISWLSHLEGFDGFTNNIETELVLGNPHQALTQVQFWKTSFANIKSTNSLETYFQLEALLWAFLAIIFIKLNEIKQLTSPKNMLVLLYFMTFSPYLMGTLYLEFNYHSIQQVGPFLAKMIFSLFYLIIPSTYLTYRNLCQRKQSE